MRVRSRQPDARAGGREVGEEERAKLPVALHETREGEDDELGGAEVVGEEPRGEFDGEAEERLEKVSHLLDAKAHQELHAKLVKANLAARLVAPQDVPPALRRHHRPSVAESAHHRLGELGRAAHRVDDGVARGGVHQPRGGAVGERALRRHRRGTAERNPTRLLLDDILHLHRESHATESAVEATFELVERHLHARHQTRLLDKDGVLVHGKHVQKTRHAPHPRAVLLQLGITLAEVHEHSLVDGERVPGHLHLDAVRRLPSGRGTLVVAKHVAVVPRAAHHHPRANLERRARSIRHPLLVVERPAHHGRFALVRVAMHELIDETRRVLHPRGEAPVEELLAKASTAHLAVSATQTEPLRRVRVVEPHQRIIVLVQQRVLQPELRELVQPDAVVVHEGGVGRDETDGHASLGHLRRDGAPRGTRADNEHVHRLARCERRGARPRVGTGP